MASENKIHCFTLNAIVAVLGLLQIISGLLALKHVYNLYASEDAYIFKSISGDRSFSYISHMIFGGIMTCMGLVGIRVAIKRCRSLVLLIHAVLLMVGMMGLVSFIMYTILVMVRKNDLAEDYSSKFEANKTNETIIEWIESQERNNTCCVPIYSTDSANNTLSTFCFPKPLPKPTDVKSTPPPLYESCSESYSKIFYKRVGRINGNYIWIAEFEIIGLICSIIIFFKAKQTRHQNLRTKNCRAASENDSSTQSIKFIE